MMMDQSREPAMEDIEAHIGSPLWRRMNSYLQDAYRAQPKIGYSQCSAQPGWNVKYQKRGMALCTLYPMEGCFIALVVIGDKQRAEAELLLPALSAYTQALYRAAPSVMGKWLMIEVTGEDRLEDAVRLIETRQKPRRA